MSSNYPESIFKKVFLFILFISPSFAQEVRTVQPRRVSSRIYSTIMDLGKVTPIYMVAGMATLIELPSSVTGIRIGNPDAIQYFRPDKPENEVTLVLRDQNAKPTNLIIRSGKRKFIFDIVPSKSIHQDSVEVVGSYGGAELDAPGIILLDSSESRVQKK